MKSLLLALQFLTIIPVKIRHINEGEPAKAMIYFPLIGLFLGFVLIGINILLVNLSLSGFPINIILIISLIALTGGIHLDGLADTTDAFSSGKPKEEMLAIMRDPHIGVMGTLILVSIILLKIGLLSSLSVTVKINALLLMCVLSRWSAVLSMFLFPYARRDGKAKIFISGLNVKIFIFSTIIALICAFAIWQIKGLLTLLVIAGYVYLSGKSISRKLGGITGDTLGATIELTELVVLFIVCIA